MMHGRIAECTRATTCDIGNGWAAGGMLRVLGTIRHSQYSHSLRHQANDLRNWVIEIHNGVYAHQVRLVLACSSPPHLVSFC